jgi:hypothetical protein
MKTSASGAFRRMRCGPPIQASLTFSAAFDTAEHPQRVTSSGQAVCEMPERGSSAATSEGGFASESSGVTQQREATEQAPQHPRAC